MVDPAGDPEILVTCTAPALSSDKTPWTCPRGNRGRAPSAFELENEIFISQFALLTDCEASGDTAAYSHRKL